MKTRSKTKPVVKRGRGRPEHEPDRHSRKKVERLIGVGMTIAETAAALGIGIETLRKHYAQEILSAKANTKAEIIAMLFASARDGQVAAQRKLIAMANDEIEHRVRTRDKYPPVGKQGKKELLQHQAENVSPLYAPPAAPKLVVDNS